MKTITVKQNEVENILNMIPKSAIMTVVFKKASGEMRTLNGRRGVKVGIVKPEDRKNAIAVKSDETKQKYVVMYEMSKKQYRNVNKTTITEIRANGMSILVK